MQVREIINLKGGTLYTATPQQTLASAIDTMAELDVGSLVVMDGGKMAGMLTFREVLLAMKAHESCPVGVTVGEVMVKDPVVAIPTMEANDLPMSGNTIGTLFAVTSFGESHGPAIGCVVDGCPPGLAISAADIQAELDRRKPGTSRHVTQRREPDEVEILSGVFAGRTTGAPIALLIRNQDQRSKDYGNIAETFRPGHADYTYTRKYGFRDHRGGGRSSARETAVRVAAGAIARKWLAERYGVSIRGWMSQLGPIEIPFVAAAEIDGNPFFAPNAAIVPELETYMDQLRKSGRFGRGEDHGDGQRRTSGLGRTGL
jgi:hypothetical protein